jgi:hypothetical protein
MRKNPWATMALVLILANSAISIRLYNFFVRHEACGRIRCYKITPATYDIHGFLLVFEIGAVLIFDLWIIFISLMNRFGLPTLDPSFVAGEEPARVDGPSSPYILSARAEDREIPPKRAPRLMSRARS